MTNDAINADKATPESTHPFVEKVKSLMSEHNVKGVMLFVLPEDSDKGYHTFSRGHFYDNAKLLSEHIKEIKSRMAHDLEGLI